MTRLGIAIAIAIMLATGGWTIRGWYEDGKVKTALEKQRKEFIKQQAADAEQLRADLKREQKVRIVYRELKNEADKTKLCANGGSDFLRLFNRGAIEANSKN